MDANASLPAAMARIVARHVAIFLGTPIDWATATALNPGLTGTVCARNNNMKHIVRCEPRVDGKQLNAWLRIAACRGYKGVVQFLCELPMDRGVDPAASPTNNALGNAARHGHKHVVQFLCELPTDRGVDPAASNNEALRWAARNGRRCWTVGGERKQRRNSSSGANGVPASGVRHGSRTPW